MRSTSPEGLLAEFKVDSLIIRAKIALLIKGRKYDEAFSLASYENRLVDVACGWDDPDVFIHSDRRADRWQRKFLFF